MKTGSGWLLLLALSCGGGESPAPEPAHPQVSGLAEPDDAPPEAALAPVESVLQASISPGSGALRISDDSGVVLAGLRIAVRSSGGPRAHAALRAVATDHTVHDWRVESQGEAGWRALADVRTETGTWQIQLSRLSAFKPVQVRAEVRFAERTLVGQESLVLRWTGLTEAVLLDRAYTEVPAQAGAIIDRWTPQEIGLKTGSDWMQLSAQAQSMRIEGRVGTVLQVVLDADHAANHPLRLFKDCADEYDPEQPAERSGRSPAPMRPGDVLTVQAQLHLERPPQIWKLRYPGGMRSALVFTDHADQSSLTKLRALMTGTSEDGGTGGFVGHGLGLTKTVFHRGRHRGPLQLSVPAYAEEVRRLIAAGVEIGPHSVGSGADKREKTAESLAVFTAMGAAPVWIDHQPATNCEALSSRGADPTSRFFVVDHLRSHGYRYAWAGTDVREPSDQINLFDPARPQAHAPVLYAHPLIDADPQTPIRLFSSVWRYHDIGTFLAKYDSDRLDRLEADRGLHIAHTYLDSLSRSAGHRGKSLLMRDGATVRVRPEVDTWLAGLAVRQSERRLWVSGVVAMADHLLAMASVSLSPVSGGVRIRSEEAVRGASFLIPGKSVDVRLDGRPVETQAQDAEGLVVWLDLAAGSEPILTWTEDPQ